jgi:DNA modification methylase
MESGSVDLLLSDLPSGETRAGFDAKIDVARLWVTLRRVLKSDGVVVFMASSLRFASELRATGPFNPFDLVWEKSVATGFLNTRYAPLRTHEYILVWAPRGAAYHPQMSEGGAPIHAARRLSHSENYNGMSRSSSSRAGATDRYPTSVLHFASVGTTSKERVHPQQKPVSLCRYLVETYSDPGDLVVDPCAGSGAVGVAAEACGRRFVGWDVSPRFGGGR